MKQGLVYIFTGEGKGKTSAAIGVAVRAALSEMKVAIVQWYKEDKWLIAEHKLGEKFENMQIYPLGSGFYKLPTDHGTPEEHKKAAQVALDKARELMGEVDVLVLDEIINTIGDKLLSEEEVVELMGERGKTHLIMTGRMEVEPASLPAQAGTVLAGADLVTECKKIKHPFDVGEKAVKGLDY